MKDVHFYAIVAGLFFGAWPLLMNRSGVTGFASATLLVGITLIFVLPVALWSGEIQKVSIAPTLYFALAASVCGALGILFFNTMLAKVSPKEVGMMFLLMLVVQITVPATYHMIMSGDYSPRKLGGIAGAFVVAYLLA